MKCFRNFVAFALQPATLGMAMIESRGIFASRILGDYSECGHGDAVWGRQKYLGQLRLDILFGGRIVVPDSQLLDGDSSWR